MSRARPRLARALAVVVFTATALPALAACGSDEETTTKPESATTTSEPTLTEPTTEVSTSTEDSGGVEPAPEPGDDSGGQAGENTSSSGQSGGSATPDTPENDVVPPAGTPQGNFEQYCNQNPGACG